MRILRSALPAASTKHLARNCTCFFALAFASFFLCENLSAQTANPAMGVTETSPATLSPAMDALVRARKLVEKYFEQASNVVCTENVTQAVVGKNGKANYREDSVFDYQMQASANSGSLKLVESRDTRKAAFRDSARSLLITNGFTSMLLIIHPMYETSYTFEPGANESVDGIGYVRIHFKPCPELLLPRPCSFAAKIIPSRFREPSGSSRKPAP